MADAAPNKYPLLDPVRDEGGGSFQIATTAHVRPCQEIAPEALENSGMVETVATRYRHLTEDLPLAGGSMMKRRSDGEIALVAQLRAATPWFEPAIASIERQLTIQNWAGRPWLTFRPICLAGAPGIGKSYLARLICDLIGGGHAALDLGGTSDNRSLEGTARGWMAAQPCWPALIMNKTRTANPVLVLEEVEKITVGSYGDAHATLLTMIEPETASRYWDKCLLAEVDLSHACWILTCNDADRLPAPLRSRLEITEIAGPAPEHFDSLLATMRRDLAARWSVSPSTLPDLPERALRILRDSFARHRSPRRLRGHVEAIVAALIPVERGATH